MFIGHDESARGGFVSFGFDVGGAGLWPSDT
jgi:hypothetical protein